MQPTTALTEDPHEALARAATFLASDPVRHNLILTLLAARCASGEAGRYWTIHSDEEVIGVVVQSPLGFPATITPMGDEALAAVARAIALGGVRLPGVNGEAGSAARFAGEWTEVANVPATPVNGQPIYEMTSLDLPNDLRGTLRQATSTDRSLVVDWFRAFQAEVGGDVRDDMESAVDRRLAARQVWLWDDHGAVSMAAATAAVAGVVRIQAVYTPAERRRRGYAAATAATLSGRILEEGWRPILYTDLANPTSNGVYRRIGYRAVVECLRYGFG